MIARLRARHRRVWLLLGPLLFVLLAAALAARHPRPTQPIPFDLHPTALPPQHTGAAHGTNASNYFSLRDKDCTERASLRSVGVLSSRKALKDVQVGEEGRNDWSSLRSGDRSSTRKSLGRTHAGEEGRCVSLSLRSRGLLPTWKSLKDVQVGMEARSVSVSLRSGASFSSWKSLKEVLVNAGAAWRGERRPTGGAAA